MKKALCIFIIVFSLFPLFSDSIVENNTNSSAGLIELDSQDKQDKYTKLQPEWEKQLKQWIEEQKVHPSEISFEWDGSNCNLFFKLDVTDKCLINNGFRLSEVRKITDQYVALFKNIANESIFDFFSWEFTISAVILFEGKEIEVLNQFYVYDFYRYKIVLLDERTYS